MKIPDKTTKTRYYVAISEQEALSSWSTFDGAVKSYNRLSIHYPEEAKRVIGIVQVAQYFSKALIRVS